MMKRSEGIGEILKRLSARRPSHDVNLLDFGGESGGRSGGASRGPLMLIVVTHAVLLGYLLGAAVLFKGGERASVSQSEQTAQGGESPQMSLHKAAREPMRTSPAPVHPPQLIAAQYLEIVPEAATDPRQEVANTIWPEDKAFQPTPPLVRPQIELRRPESPAVPAHEPPPSTPADAAPPVLTPNRIRRQPAVELAGPPASMPASPIEETRERAAAPFMSPRPPQQFASRPPLDGEQVQATPPPQKVEASTPELAVQEEAPVDPQTLRSARWPEDSGHSVREIATLPEPAEPQNAPALAPPDQPVTADTAPSSTIDERMAAASPIPEPMAPMIQPAERIGDPGIIIDRFVALEEPAVAVPMPERRGLQAGEVATQELSASLGPDLTVLKTGGKRDKLLAEYRAKVRAHLAGLKPPGGFGSDTVVVGFTLTRAGKVVSAKIVESRGIYLLEQGTLNAVYAAAPFPKPPGGLKGARFEFAIPFHFQ
jgi:protein TonB